MLLFPRQITSRQLETSEIDDGKKMLKHEVEMSTGLKGQIHKELQGLKIFLLVIITKNKKTKF